MTGGGGFGLALAAGEKDGGSQAHETTKGEGVHCAECVAEVVDVSLEFAVTDLSVEFEPYDSDHHKNKRL